MSGPFGKLNLFGQERTHISLVTLAIYNQRDDLLSVSLEHFNRNLDPYGYYAIALAVEQNRQKLVRDLLDRKADQNRVVGPNGFTLLNYTEISGYNEVAKELIRHGAKKSHSVRFWK